MIRYKVHLLQALKKKDVPKKSAAKIEKNNQVIQVNQANRVIQVKIYDKNIRYEI